MKTSAVETVRAAWGADAPVWLPELAEECDRTSLRAVAAALGISPGGLSQALRRTYPSPLDGIGRKWMQAQAEALTVVCPILGEISPETCRTQAARPFAATNPQRVTLWRACRACDRGET